MNADTVIDIKGIDECNVLEIQGDQFIIGSAVTLNEITESKFISFIRTDSETNR